MRKAFLRGLLGIFSILLAEMNISSQSLVFYSTGILLIIAFHILFIALLVMKKEQPLQLCGLIFTVCLFGLFVVYMTKGLWNPYWHENTITILQVSVFSFLFVVSQKMNLWESHHSSSDAVKMGGRRFLYTAKCPIAALVPEQYLRGHQLYMFTGF